MSYWSLHQKLNRAASSAARLTPPLHKEQPCWLKALVSLACSQVNIIYLDNHEYSFSFCFFSYLTKKTNKYLKALQITWELYYFMIAFEPCKHHVNPFKNIPHCLSGFCELEYSKQLTQPFPDIPFSRNVMNPFFFFLKMDKWNHIILHILFQSSE